MTTEVADILRQTELLRSVPADGLQAIAEDVPAADLPARAGGVHRGRSG